jgi:signal transduction histidine kinase
MDFSVATIWPHFATLFLLGALGWYSWRRGTVPGARPLSFACLFQALWVIGAAAELVAPGIPAKIAWFQFQAVWKASAVTAATCFSLEYVSPGRWLTRRRLILVSIVPLLVLLLALTNDLHHWYWIDFVYDGAVKPTRSVLNWITNAYGMGLVLVNMTAFAWLFVHSPPHRWPVVLMVAGQLVGRVLYALDLAGRYPATQPDPIILSLVTSTVTYAIALFAFRILDPLPAARTMVVRQMREGMVVFDANWKAVSYNPVAERMLDLQDRHARKLSWQELLPSAPDASACLASGADRVEVRLGDCAQARYYALGLNPLTDHRGLTIGYLLLLQDVTAQHQAQAQLVEQQRALAMFSEREQLARELHDSIGQVLGYVKMQAQAARDRLARDQVQAADGDLARLVAVVQDAHVDVREYIMGAQVSASTEPRFLPALRQYLARFSEHYDLRAELIAPPEGVDGCLEPTVEAQLLRIVQEALTNVRKHAQAREVRVGIELAAEHAEVIVIDDGDGFDPAQLTPGEGLRYGVGFMRERAHEVGGSVEIESAPGEGTRVVVCVPRRRERQ